MHDISYNCAERAVKSQPTLMY